MQLEECYFRQPDGGVVSFRGLACGNVVYVNQPLCQQSWQVLRQNRQLKMFTWVYLLQSVCQEPQHQVRRLSGWVLRAGKTSPDWEDCASLGTTHMQRTHPAERQTSHTDAHSTGLISCLVAFVLSITCTHRQIVLMLYPRARPPVSCQERQCKHILSCNDLSHLLPKDNNWPTRNLKNLVSLHTVMVPLKSVADRPS